MIINLTNKNCEQVHNESKLVVNGETWEFVKELDKELNEDGAFVGVIYTQPSSGKYFKVDISYSRCGYDDYVYYLEDQSHEAYEVTPKQKTVTEWIVVK